MTSSWVSSDPRVVTIEKQGADRGSDFNQIADILDSDPHDLDLQGTDLHDPDILNTDLHDLDLSSISQYHLYALVSNEI